MVVEDGRAARERELGEARARGNVLGLRIDPRPERVERLQPGEEVGFLRPGPRECLVEVVVRVYEARGDDGAAEVDPLVRLRFRSAARSGHEAVLDEQPARLVLGARVVHDDDVGVRK